MDREEKIQFVSDLHSRLEKAQGTFLVHYKGLKVSDINSLRNKLRDTGAEFQVVKNRLLKLACQGTETESIKDHMEGPTAITLTYDDLIGPAKTLVDFAKDFKQLEIKSGQISGKQINAEAVKQLAQLPGREVLLSQVLAAMQAVPASFVRLLGGIMGQLLNVLKAIEQQKEA
ncbi:MAG: 50S ribosomal protein L10 [Deltaproteobacteria bacterium]|nr:50S ribosomal protein L10 [Deltaproteobacteria bacterium]MBW2143331.1 50S ribosomal protein L10 [Deltaproteobacteria bacterium]